MNDAMNKTETIQERIINYLKRNRVSTTEVADCLGKAGLFPGAKPIVCGMYKVGIVHWVYGCNESNWTIHEMVREVRPGQVVLMEGFHVEDRALIGELVSKYILLYQQAEAIVTNEKMRDANGLLKNRYAVWCRGFTPIGCFNREENAHLDEETIRVHKEMYDGTIAVCDDCGVVIIPRDQHTEAFLQKLVDIEEQEDIWFACLDRKKWDTFDIVCRKRYLQEAAHKDQNT